MTANIPEKGITTLMGWITEATKHSLLVIDEDNNETLIDREQLVGSIVVVLEQIPIPKKTTQNGIFYGVNDFECAELTYQNVRK